MGPSVHMALLEIVGVRGNNTIGDILVIIKMDDIHQTLFHLTNFMRCPNITNSIDNRNQYPALGSNHLILMGGGGRKTSQKKKSGSDFR